MKTEEYKKGYVDGFKDCQVIIKEHVIKSIIDTDILIKDLKYKEIKNEKK